MWTGQRRATRGFVLVSVAALVLPASIVGWLGWLLLHQDRELDHTRVTETAARFVRKLQESFKRGTLPS